MTARVLNNVLINLFLSKLTIEWDTGYKLLFCLLALHIIAIAVYKAEKIVYACKFDIAGTMNFLIKTEAVLTLKKNQYIVYACLCVCTWQK